MPIRSLITHGHLSKATIPNNMANQPLVTATQICCHTEKLDPNEATILNLDTLTYQDNYN